MPTKKTEDKTADEKRQEAERQAREANQNRNREQVERRNAIADGADRIKDEQDAIEPLTDEKWAEGDRPEDAPTRKSRDEIAAEIEADEKQLEADEQQEARETPEEDLDEARDSGATDSRKSAAGEVEYRLVVNGKEKWLTLSQLRETAGKVEAADEYLQEAKSGSKREATHVPDPAALEAERQARERQAAEAAAYKSKLKDLYTKASMGDEQAIEELADIQAGLSRVTPDVLRMLDERVDARMTGRTAFEQAVSWFEDEYADELRSANLKGYAARRDTELANANPQMPARERLAKVGEELRQIREDLGVKPASSTQPETKAQRKASVPQVVAAGGRTRPATETDEVQSTGDAIRDMAKARGQARAVRH